MFLNFHSGSISSFPYTVLRKSLSTDFDTVFTKIHSNLRGRFIYLIQAYYVTAENVKCLKNNYQLTQRHLLSSSQPTKLYIYNKT